MRATTSTAHKARLAAVRDAAEHTSLGLWDHIRNMVRHRWWAVGGFVLLAAPMAAITLLTTPVYFATTRLLLQEEADQRVGVTTGGDGGARSALDPFTQSQLVTSRVLVKDVATELRLWQEPEFADGVPATGDDAAKADAVVDALLSRLSVTRVPDSQVIVIGVEARDPALAARVANAVASRFIERDRQSRFDAASAAAEWLSKRLAEQREQVAASERALQSYRATRDAMSLLDRQNIVGQKLGDLNSAVTRAKTDRILRETQYQQIQGLKGDAAALESHPLIAANTFVQSLKGQVADLTRQDAQLAERLGPKHPDRIQVAASLASLQTRLRAEVDKIVSGIETDYQAAVAQEESLTRALNSQKSEASTLDRKGVEYAALEREAVSARGVYDALLQQTREASLSSGVQKSTARVVDAAEPPAIPVRPRRGQGLAAAAVLGLVGAASAVFAREYLRRKVYSPMDLEQRLGVAMLALVPTTTDAEGSAAGALSPIPAEAFRRLRATILLEVGPAGSQSSLLVVTSAAPGDGKTFVAAHLAVALAAARQRVVLVDADMRRPRLHAMFDHKRTPGLSDLLLARCGAEEVLIPVEATPGLVVVPSGIPTADASELLSLPGYQEFIDSLRADFDWIIVDSPPVLAVTDAAVLAQTAAGVIFVTSAERTTLEAAEAALKVLDDAGARVLGAVLNRAPVSKETFYYSRYYRPEYNTYLTGADDPAPGS